MAESTQAPEVKNQERKKVRVRVFEERRATFLFDDTKQTVSCNSGTRKCTHTMECSKCGEFLRVCGAAIDEATKQNLIMEMVCDYCTRADFEKEALKAAKEMIARLEETQQRDVQGRAEVAASHENVD